MCQEFFKRPPTEIIDFPWLHLHQDGTVLRSHAISAFPDAMPTERIFNQSNGLRAGLTAFDRWSLPPANRANGATRANKELIQA